MSHITPTVLSQIKPVIQETVVPLVSRLTDCPNLPVQDFINVNDTYWLTDESSTPSIDNLTVNGLTVNNYLNANVEAGISTINTFGITVLGAPGKVDANLGDFNAVSTTSLQVYQDISCGGNAIIGDLTTDTIAANEIQATAWLSTLGLHATNGYISTLYSSTIANTNNMLTSSIRSEGARFTSSVQLGDSALWTTDTTANPTGNTYNFLKLNYGTLSFAKGYGAIGIAPGDPDTNDAGPLFVNTSKRDGSSPTSIDYVRTSKFWSEAPATTIAPGGYADFALEVEGIITVYAASNNGFGAFRVISVGNYPSFTTHVLTDAAQSMTIADSGTAGAGAFRINNGTASVATVFWHQMSAPGYN